MWASRPVQSLSACTRVHFTLLTPWCRVLEQLTGLQLVKKFPVFHGNRRFITALTSVRQLSLSWASPIQCIYPHPNSWRSILILSIHLRLGLPNGLLPSGFPTKTLYTSISSTIRATCRAHHILLDFITRTILGEQYKSFSSSLCNLLHSPVTSSLLGPNILLNTMFSNTPSLTIFGNISKCCKHDNICADWQAVCTNIHEHSHQYSGGYCNSGEHAYQLNLCDMWRKQFALLSRQETPKQGADRSSQVNVVRMSRRHHGKWSIYLNTKPVRTGTDKLWCQADGTCCCSTGDVRCFWACQIFLGGWFELCDSYTKKFD